MAALLCPDFKQYITNCSVKIGAQNYNKFYKSICFFHLFDKKFLCHVKNKRIDLFLQKIYFRKKREGKKHKGTKVIK
jgi:hypothetical protein